MNTKTYVTKVKQKVTFLAKAILNTNSLPDETNARKTLNKYYPDIGLSCFLADNQFNEVKYDLSIVIPVYNAAHYLEKCLNSVIKQMTSYTFEVIIVNDGSTDESEEIISKFIDYPNVVIISQENQGHSGARNTAINISKCNYLMFVDSDDILLPNAIESLMTVAVNNDADVVAGNYIKSYENGVTKIGSNYSTERVNPMISFYGMPWGKVYKRMLFEHLRFPENYWFEDSIFAQIVWPIANKCYTVENIVYDYYINPNGISQSSLENPKAIDSLYITEQLIKDKSLFGIKLSEEDYHYFLKMVHLTKRRTDLLDTEVQKSIFVIQQELRNTYYSKFDCKSFKYKQLENALLTGNYRKYCVLCEIII